MLQFVTLKAIDLGSHPVGLIFFLVALALASYVFLVASNAFSYCLTTAGEIAVLHRQDYELKAIESDWASTDGLGAASTDVGGSDGGSDGGSLSSGRTLSEDGDDSPVLVGTSSRVVGSSATTAGSAGAERSFANWNEKSLQSHTAAEELLSTPRRSAGASSSGSTSSIHHDPTRPGSSSGPTPGEKFGSPEHAKLSAAHNTSSCSTAAFSSTTYLLSPDSTSSSPVLAEQETPRQRRPESPTNSEGTKSQDSLGRGAALDETLNRNPTFLDQIASKKNVLDELYDRYLVYHTAWHVILPCFGLVWIGSVNYL